MIRAIIPIVKAKAIPRTKIWELTPQHLSSTRGRHPFTWGSGWTGTEGWGCL